MSSRGRGIRQITPQSTPNTSLINQEPICWQSPLDSLAIKVAILDINDDEQLQEVEVAIRKYCTDVEKFRLLIDDLHERSLTDSEFGVRAAASLATSSMLTVDDTKLRNVLIQNLQDDFTQSDKLRLIDKPRFLNAAAFLSEVCFRVKLADNLPISVLLGAHIAYQKKLLKGDRSDLELFVKLWAKHGSTLLALQPTDVNDMLRLVFVKCLEEDTDSTCRAWLMLAIELFHDNFRSIPKQFIDLFELNLGKEAVLRIQAVLHRNDISEKAVEDPRKNTDSRSPPQHAQERGNNMKSQEGPDCRVPLQRTQERGHNEGTVFARLGSRTEDDGRRNRPPRDGRMDSANWLPQPERSPSDIEKWGLNKVSASYSYNDHDDRCERNYHAKGQINKAGDRYHQGGLRTAAEQPLPGDESWD